MAQADAQQPASSAAGAVTQLVSALAAGGAAIVAGAQLSTLGALEDPLRLAVAIGGALVATAAVIVGVLTFVDQSLPVQTSLSSLVTEEQAKPTSVHTPAVETVLLSNGYEDVGTLNHDYAEALARRREAMIRNLADPNNATKVAAEQADKPAQRLNAAVSDLLDAVQADRARTIDHRARRRLPILGLLLLLAIASVLWATNPPTPEPLDLRGADLTGHRLRDVELRGVVLDGMTIRQVDLAGSDLEDASVEDTTWVDTICPDGTNSDEAGRTCAGHLEP